MDLGEALQQCVQSAVRRRQLARGLNECARALDQRRAVLCVLSKACAEENYIKLIKALCNEHQIPIMQVDDSALLGTWAGLAKYDEEGEVRKVVKCACVVLQHWGDEGAAQQTVQGFLKTSE